MIKAVFIDIDNTILDFDAYVEETIRTGFEHFGICHYEPYMVDVFHQENNKLWLMIEQGTLDIEGLKKIRFNNIFRVLGVEFDGTVFEKYFRGQLNESAIPVEGAVELIRSLSKDYIICTASNGPYNQQVHRMDIAGLSDCISHHFISERFGSAKPSKQYFDCCFAEFESSGENIKPEETVMLGDSLTADISGGKDYGMKTIYFNKHGKENSSEITPDFTIYMLSEAEKIIRSL